MLSSTLTMILICYKTYSNLKTKTFQFIFMSLLSTIIYIMRKNVILAIKLRSKAGGRRTYFFFFFFFDTSNVPNQVFVWLNSEDIYKRKFQRNKAKDAEKVSNTSIQDNNNNYKSVKTKLPILKLTLLIIISATFITIFMHSPALCSHPHFFSSHSTSRYLLDSHLYIVVFLHYNIICFQ